VHILEEWGYMFLSHHKAVGIDWKKRIPIGLTLEKIDENFLYSPRYINS
jgi:hypothetical protein